MTITISELYLGACLGSLATLAVVVGFAFIVARGRK